MIKRIKCVLVILITILYFQEVQAQPPNKNKDFFNIKAPAIEYPSPNPDDVLFEDKMKDSSGTSEKYDVGPVKKPSMLEDEEDTVFFDDADGELSVVEVDEQIIIDTRLDHYCSVLCYLGFPDDQSLQNRWC